MDKSLPQRRYVLAALSFAFVAIAGLSVQPASAATVSFVLDDVEYTADDTDVSAGATITGYSGVGGALVIPATVVNGSETYAVKGIDTDAFKAKSISDVNLPSSLTSIGASAFQNNSLTAVIIPSGVTSIGTYAFFNNDLTAINFPANLNSIGNNAFGYNALTTVTIPSLVTQVNAYAFQYNQLTSISIPIGATGIQTGAFRFNQLTSVTIPSNVTLIGDRAFEGNESLTTVHMDGGAPTVTDAGANGSFGSGLGLTVYCEAEFAEEYQSPWHGYTTDDCPAQPANESLAPTGADLRATSLSSLVAMALVALAGAAVIARRRITKA